MFIEEILQKIVNIYGGNIKPLEFSILQSICNQVNLGFGLTEKQAIMVISIFKKNKYAINKMLKNDITYLLDNPKFSKSFRVINNTYNVRADENSIYLETPYDNDIITKIKTGRSGLGKTKWDPETKTWIFSLNEKSILFIMDLLSKVNYNYDENFKTYIDQIEKIKKNVDSLIPHLALDGENLFIKNPLPFLPKITSTNILDAIFEARKLGIFTWSDEISEILEEKQLNPATLQFIKSDPGTVNNFDPENFSLSDLSEVINYMAPCLFVLPGGVEFEKLKESMTLFEKSGFAKDEISVLFRLSNKTDKEFNDFIKNEGLNNPISEKTKAVIITTKLPKVILSSKIKFHTVVAFGNSNVYSFIKEYTKRHENLIYFMEKSKQKGLNFGFM